jgi:LuxR family transcriptional regulator, maltose regulon positive regulatory protein
VIEILALHALALQEIGQLTPALDSLERALVLAEPEGYIRTFADHGEPMGLLLHQVAARGVAPMYVARLLAAIASPQGSVGESDSHRARVSERESALMLSGVEPLTAREVEVLHLLAGGAFNQRIADELTVSVGTVKAHISHILGKIGAHNRTEAVVRARKLGLLERE